MTRHLLRGSWALKTAGQVGRETLTGGLTWFKFSLRYVGLIQVCFGF